jgi:nicotinamide-nucleotide amidase
MGVFTVDHLSLARDLLALARARPALITVAESCSGGLLAGAITEIAGASDIFQRGYITYSNAAKIEMLGVLTETLDTFGAVSEQVAAQMAQGALARAEADLALSVTGIAGPGGSEHKSEGRVCFGLVLKDVQTITETVEFGAIGRTQVRAASVEHALKMAITALY